MWTLSSLQLHPHPLIIVDEDATLELKVKTVKYFKSIEKVGDELGFRQMLPRKRDSLVEDQLLTPFAASQQEDGSNSLTLAVPQPNISRSASPVLGPMSVRIVAEKDASVAGMSLEDEPQLAPMSARVAA